VTPRRGARPIGRGAARRSRLVAAVPVVLVAAAGCALVRSGSPSPASSAPSTTTTLAPTTTTTIPASPQPTAEAAADDLVGDWAAGNRAAALTVATPAAVTAMFATAYPPGEAVSRGCSTAFAPFTCTFGPPGGGDPNLPLYSLTLLTAPGGGWYVSAAVVER